MINKNVPYFEKSHNEIIPSNAQFFNLTVGYDTNDSHIFYSNISSSDNHTPTDHYDIWWLFHMLACC